MDSTTIPPCLNNAHRESFTFTCYGITKTSFRWAFHLWHWSSFSSLSSTTYWWSVINTSSGQWRCLSEIRDKGEGQVSEYEYSLVSRGCRHCAWYTTEVINCIFRRQVNAFHQNVFLLITSVRMGFSQRYKWRYSLLRPNVTVKLFVLFVKSRVHVRRPAMLKCLEAMLWQKLQIGHNRFLAYRLQFIIHGLFYMCRSEDFTAQMFLFFLLVSNKNVSYLIALLSHSFPRIYCHS